MQQISQQTSMFGLPGFRVKITQLQETAEVWLETGVRSGGLSLTDWASTAPSGLSGRMCLGSSLATAVKISQQSSIPSLNAGMASSGGCLMLNTLEWRNDAAVCSLSDILEVNPDPKFLLSAKACLGILRRSETRGVRLPTPLLDALTKVATPPPTP